MGQLNPSSDNYMQHRTNALISTVFEKEVLFNKIIGNIILQRGSAKTTKCIRLVSRSWHGTVTRLYRQQKLPLYHISLTQEFPALKFTDFLEMLIQARTSQYYNDDKIPQFQFNLHENFFSIENHSILQKCLTSCGSGIVSVNITIPSDAGGMPIMFPNFSLPRLNSAKFCISNTTTVNTDDEDEYKDDEIIDADCVAAMYFIQIILNAATNLQSLTITTKRAHGSVYGFKFLRLPSSLKDLDLNCKLSSIQLESILRQKLFLKNITILISQENIDSFKNSTVIEQLLQKFCETIKTFNIRGLSNENTLDDFVNIKMPSVLDTLDTHYNVSAKAAPFKAATQFARYLPKMDNFKMISTQSYVEKWIKDNLHNFVCTIQNSLNFSLVDENLGYEEVGHTLPFTVEIAQMIHTTFPNVASLLLKIDGSENGLKYVFLEMKQLRSLTIEVINDTSGIGSDFWDALLTGVPEEIIVGFRQNPHFLEQVEFSMDKSFPSIQSLSKLRSLSLCENVLRADVSHKSLISDFSFNVAFLNMPELKILEMEGRFFASVEMTKKWKQTNGRAIYWTPSNRSIFD